MMEEALAVEEEEPLKMDWRQRFYDMQTQSIKEDIRNLKDDVKELRQDIKRLDAKIDGVRDELNTKIDDLRDDLKKDIRDLNNKMNENLWKTLVGISIILGIFHYATK